MPEFRHAALGWIERAKADIFLTGDRTLERCPGLTVEVLSGPRTIS